MIHTWRGRGEGWRRSVSFILGLLGAVAFGRDDILGSGDCDASQVLSGERVLTLLFGGPALSKGMSPSHVGGVDSRRETDAD